MGVWCFNDAEPRAGSVCLSEIRSYRLSKWDRIRKSHEFEVVMRRGASRQTQNFKIRLLSNRVGWARLGLVVGKRVGNACVRNRVKRRLREFFRLNRQIFPPGSDVVIIAKVGAGAIESEEMYQELGSVFS